MVQVFLLRNLSRVLLQNIMLSLISKEKIAFKRHFVRMLISVTNEDKSYFFFTKNRFKKEENP